MTLGLGGCWVTGSMQKLFEWMDYLGGQQQNNETICHCHCVWARTERYRWTQVWRATAVGRIDSRHSRAYRSAVLPFFLCLVMERARAPFREGCLFAFGWCGYEVFLMVRYDMRQWWHRTGAGCQTHCSSCRNWTTGQGACIYGCFDIAGGRDIKSEDMVDWARGSVTLVGREGELNTEMIIGPLESFRCARAN